MGIRFLCPNGHKLNVKDFQAGRKGFCPQCGVPLRIPLSNTRFSTRFWKQKAKRGKSKAAGVSLPDEVDAPPPTPQDVAPFAYASSSTGSEPIDGFDDALDEAPNAVWYVRPQSGGQYGPADAELMRIWLAEGRVGAHAFVWRDGWGDWRPAGKVFTWLTPSQAVFELDDLIENPVGIPNPKCAVKSGIAQRGAAMPGIVTHRSAALKKRRFPVPLIISFVVAGIALAALLLAIGLSQ